MELLLGVKRILSIRIKKNIWIDCFKLSELLHWSSDKVTI